MDFVVGNLAVGALGFADRLPVNELYVHARLSYCLDGRELDAAAVVLADAVVFRPVREGQRSDGSLAIDLGCYGCLLRLSDFGMFQGTVVDAVLLAPAEVCALRQERLVADDTLRLRNGMLFAPVVPLFDAGAGQLGELGQLPVGMVPVDDQAHERCQYEERRNPVAEPAKNREPSLRIDRAGRLRLIRRGMFGCGLGRCTCNNDLAHKGAPANEGNTWNDWQAFSA